MDKSDERSQENALMSLKATEKRWLHAQNVCHVSDFRSVNNGRQTPNHTCTRKHTNIKAFHACNKGPVQCLGYLAR